MLKVNNAGDSIYNPILVDNVGNNLKFKATLNKQNANETLKHCWIYANDKIYTDLTARCVTTDFTIYVLITGGIDTYAPYRTASLNTLYFTTTLGVVTHSFYSAQTPIKMITLDGYNGRTTSTPLIYPIYRS